MPKAVAIKSSALASIACKNAMTMSIATFMSFGAYVAMRLITPSSNTPRVSNSFGAESIIICRRALDNAVNTAPILFTNAINTTWKDSNIC